MKQDLLVVSLAPHDAPLADAAWDAAAAAHCAALDAVTCRDPDPALSRALVDSRHTFLEMCQFRHYQFDSLRRAKHSSAMVLYHLHRPEAHSLNPFCMRCNKPIRALRHHCSQCSYELCSACERDMNGQCLEMHPLTPYRVTFCSNVVEPPRPQPLQQQQRSHQLQQHCHAPSQPEQQQAPPPPQQQRPPLPPQQHQPQGACGGEAAYAAAAMDVVAPHEDVTPLVAHMPPPPQLPPPQQPLLAQ
ncbi:hypothetical protein JKP88DRAFT_229943 [Tribonema minus]|uniref:histone acetyltransferase n=1 Tax=Tribonema minus TaxID=303371 RepID=A0A835ZDI9_9STRA|nr:hypothetical protein JKP88DRAFT_229943 [Tribonema minus]